ncbi:MAG: hypothetical protein OXM01_08835 [Gemmatimonadota bacterium]|nr:hypothetical protein [Gemmatimonadota bacterium]
MNASEPEITRDDVIAELDARIGHVAAVLKGRRGNVRRSLTGWQSALEDARKSVVAGTITAAEVNALVHRGCRLAGAVPAQRVGHDGETEVWIATDEAVSGNVAIVQRLGRLLRTQASGGDASP